MKKSPMPCERRDLSSMTPDEPAKDGEAKGECRHTPQATFTVRRKRHGTQPVRRLCVDRSTCLLLLLLLHPPPLSASVSVSLSLPLFLTLQHISSAGRETSRTTRMMSESTTDRCTRVGAYFERCGGVHACLRASVVFTLCPPGLSSFFCYTHTQPAEPNLPAHVFTTQQSLCRSRGGFSGVGGEFTEAFSRSLPREPFLGRIWNIGSSRRPVFSNELYGTVG